MSTPHPAQGAPTDDSRPRYLDWCERNAKPKNHFYPKPKRELTQWQKRGPMTRRDWVRFYQWASKNAMPRPPFPTAIFPPPREPIKRRKFEKVRWSDVLDDLPNLSKPRWPRDKYEFPPEPDYPYSPKIHWKLPPHHDRGRPFRPPPVPIVFQHYDIEHAFWATLRFPIRSAALRYKPSANILRLAKPRVIRPEDLHCPLPEVMPEYVAPRRRMTRRQWRAHLLRLEYLAKPVQRPLYYDPYLNECI